LDSLESISLKLKIHHYPPFLSSSAKVHGIDGRFSIFFHIVSVILTASTMSRRSSPADTSGSGKTDMSLGPCRSFLSSNSKAPIMVYRLIECIAMIFLRVRFYLLLFQFSPFLFLGTDWRIVGD
jgi:hypothetical protein